MAIASGTRLGPYDILSPLGVGGFGEVYKARDTRLDRTVAIKILWSKRHSCLEKTSIRDARNAYKMMTVWRKGADIYLIDRVKGQWSFTETCRQVKALRQRYPRTGRILIEAAANGPAISDALGSQVPGLIGVTPTGSKRARILHTRAALAV